jgi:small conductance mechanosensitive channel
MAWSGLLSNFAAGAFLILLRPFKVGDFIEAGGVIGTVQEIGLFVTAVDTMDNVRVFVGNNAVFSGNIKNFHTNEYRRVDLVAQLPHGVDPRGAIEQLKAALDKIPNTVNKADVEILEFNLAGPVLAVRPYVHNDHYWQVYFDTNNAIRDVFTEAGYPVPQKHLHIQQQAG